MNRRIGHSGSAPASRLDWSAGVAEVIARWPVDRPLAALVSGGGGGQWARWSILAAPGAALTTLSEVEAVLTASPRHSDERRADEPPFHAGWIGWIGYEAGRTLEPAAIWRGGKSPADDRDWPEACLRRCDGAYVFDHQAGRWWATGDGSALPTMDFSWRPDEVDAVSAGQARSAGSTNRGEGGWDDQGALTGEARARYEAMVERALEYIRAGDIFQVNVGRRLTREFAGSPRALCVRLVESMAPWFGALIEGPRPGRAVVSASPELFLRIDAGTGRIVTRPIKGTAPGGGSPVVLVDSEKDRAELTMIVDLMRNDLGRICECGTVRVEEQRAIERHGSRLDAAGVWHGVATVAGRVRENVTTGEALRAAFPAGSITGAPKIRAMQIVEELEPVTRGPYCGSVGWFDDSGACEMNVAIRSAAIAGASRSGTWADVRGVLDYFVGAGIVADSVPALEWEETQAKAAGFLEAMEAMRGCGAIAGKS